MRKVIFLGAGASVAEGAPDQSHLFNEYFKLVQDEPRHTEMERELSTFFYLMFDIDVDHENLNSTLFPTFEEAIGILDLAELRRESLRDYDLETVAANSNRIRFIRQYLVLAMAEIIARTLQRETMYHRPLIKNLADYNLLPETLIISANYDIIIDNVLLEHYEHHGFPPGKRIDYGVRFANCTMGRWDEPAPDATCLLKIHGSLNWLFCRTCNCLTLTPGVKGVMNLVENPSNALCNFCQSLLTPVIVPPSFYKDMSNVFLGQVWNKAEVNLRDADQIIFCGYSFPDADMHIKYLLKRIETNRQAGRNLRITVINNHPGKQISQSELEKERYSRFFKSEVDFTDASFQDFASSPQKFYAK
jgi:NAD-dependent SIR2 family protein deacetylase